MSTVTLKSSLALILGCSISSFAWAITPLDEQSMGNVSAETSQGILNLYGASAAGLRLDDNDSSAYDDNFAEVSIDIDTPQSNYSDSDEAQPAAKEELKKLEDQATQMAETGGTQPALDSNTLEEVIGETERFARDSQSFYTSSKITYKPHGHHHDMQMMADGTVRIERDLRIERLEFDQLQGDEFDDNTFGNLYLSDWASQGTSRILSFEN